jgi:hypothetical protein
LNGKVTNGTWKYISANKSLIIGTTNQSYMVHAAFIDATLLTLQVDGTEECAFLVNETNKQTYLPQTYSDIMGYFLIKEQMCIKEEEERKQRQLEEEKARLEAEERRKEEERLRAIEEAERLKLWEEEQKRLEIERTKQEEKRKKIQNIIYVEELELTNLINKDERLDKYKKYTFICLMVAGILGFLTPAAYDFHSDVLLIVLMFIFLLVAISVYSLYHFIKTSNSIMNNWLDSKMEKSDLAMNKFLVEYIEYQKCERNLGFSMILIIASLPGWILILLFAYKSWSANKQYNEAKNQLSY